jgi:hypothetical protein
VFGVVVVSGELAGLRDRGLGEAGDFQFNGSAEEVEQAGQRTAFVSVRGGPDAGDLRHPLTVGALKLCEKH